MGRKKISIKIRFWNKVKVIGKNDCWKWLAYKDKDSYGRIGTDSIHRNIAAHRVSWILHYGEIPKNKLVCHKCDNPSCVNPQHLFLGTIQDNNFDKVKKNRQAQGEKNGSAKLKKSQIQEIKKIYQTGNFTLKEVGKMFGVTYATISYIVNGKTWIYETS